MDNIILIGMPGVGKSTAGVILAKVMGYDFVDSDLLIQQREGRLLAQIIEEDGVDGFLAIEESVNASIDMEKCVIATGGSAVYSDKAMNHLKKIGKVVYLRLGYNELKRRLDDIKQRGVVLREGQTLEDLNFERSLLYEMYADIIIDEGNHNIEETVKEIVEKLKNL